MMWTLSLLSLFLVDHLKAPPPLFSRIVSKKVSALHSVQVLTDVDDTLKSSGGVKFGEIALGGVDTQYARDIIYPGAMQFIFELSKHGAGIGGGSGRRGSGLMNFGVLTARAEELKFALEIKYDNPLAVRARSVGKKSGEEGWGMGPVMYGSIAEWIVQGNKGRRKFDNFQQLKERDVQELGDIGQSIKYIFLGDTGEYDEEGGVRMLQSHPDSVLAVFLHVVSDEPEETRVRRLRDKAQGQIFERRYVRGRPVCYFRTYVGAAVEAYKCGLLSKNAVGRVVEETLREAKELLGDFGDEKENEKENVEGGGKVCSRWGEILVDIENGCHL